MGQTSNGCGLELNRRATNDTLRPLWPLFERQCTLKGMLISDTCKSDVGPLSRLQLIILRPMLVHVYKNTKSWHPLYF